MKDTTKTCQKVVRYCKMNCLSTSKEAVNGPPSIRVKQPPIV